MAALLGGRLDTPSYCLLLVNLEPIYRKLEAGLMRNAHHCGITPILFPSLFRSRALQTDLESLSGSSWRDRCRILPASVDYVSHLNVIEEQQPELLAAHAYVRYLGDLSGGQMLKKIVAGSLQLQAGHGGTDFYDFGEPAEVARLSQAFRAGLNALKSGECVVAEALIAFEMHARLFDELAKACGLAPKDVKAAL